MTDPTTSGGPAGLADRVQQIHVPEPNADRERLMLILGGVLAIVGVVCVLVGYWGASGTTKPSEQIPYALSGGALGLALVVLGSALVTRFSLARLFRYWLARIVYEHQVQTDRTVEALGRIEALLANGSDASPAPPPPPAGADVPRIRKEPLRAEPLES